MSDTVCRVAVHATGQQATVDLVLPAACPVAMLLPAVVDTVLGGAAPETGAVRWFLAGTDGLPLDTSETLAGNGVCDGDLILLTSAALPAPRPAPRDPCAVVAATAADSADLGPKGAAATVLAVFAVLSATLVWAGAVGGTESSLWVAAALSAAAATGAVAGRTPHPMPVVLSSGAVLFAAVTGALAAQWPPGDVALAQASLAALAMSLVLLRLSFAAIAILTGCAAVSAAVAVAALLDTAGVTPTSGAGALLTVVSLGALSSAPKLTVAVAGLGPSRSVVGARRARTARSALTGLVAGWSGTAALGAAVVALDTSVAPALAAGFAAVVGLVLPFRQRVHVDTGRRIALCVAGFGALATALAVGVSAAPATAPWLCAGVAAAGAGALTWWMRAAQPNPVLRSALQCVEYLALAAVIPLAVWVSGLYGVVRDLSLP